MTLHLVKLCVGADSVESLQAWIDFRMDNARKTGLPAETIHTTRMVPTRKDELLDGGSLYWVIKRIIAVRQPIIGLESVKREDGRSACAILLSNQYIRTVPRRSRAFQGWRYFPAEDAPADLGHGPASIKKDLPPEMAAELRELGLL